MIHICLKTCNVCATKYICKTQQDPYKYEGSGTEWKEHNKRCGINHTTEILFSSDSIKEVELFCEEYERQNPEYWKTSDNANMIMERGGYNNSGKANPNYKHGRATGWKSDKRIQKNVLEVGKYIKDNLVNIQGIKEIRQYGLMIGIEFDKKNQLQNFFH